MKSLCITPPQTHMDGRNVPRESRKRGRVVSKGGEEERNERSQGEVAVGNKGEMEALNEEKERVQGKQKNELGKDRGERERCGRGEGRRGKIPAGEQRMPKSERKDSEMAPLGFLSGAKCLPKATELRGRTKRS